MTVRDALSTQVAEKSTRKLTGTIVDENGNPLADSDLDTVTLTLYDELSHDVINSQTGTNILNTNNGTVDSGGNWALVLQGDDNTIVDATRPIETHVALISWTWNGGLSQNYKEITFPVVNLEKVT